MSEITQFTRADVERLNDPDIMAVYNAVESYCTAVGDAAFNFKVPLAYPVSITYTSRGDDEGNRNQGKAAIEVRGAVWLNDFLAAVETADDPIARDDIGKAWKLCGALLELEAETIADGNDDRLMPFLSIIGGGLPRRIDFY